MALKQFIKKHRYLFSLLGGGLTLATTGISIYTYYQITTNAYEKVIYHINKADNFAEKAKELCEKQNKLCSLVIDRANKQLTQAAKLFISERSQLSAEDYREISNKIKRTRIQILKLSLNYGVKIQ